MPAPWEAAYTSLQRSGSEQSHTGHGLESRAETSGLVSSLTWVLAEGSDQGLIGSSTLFLRTCWGLPQAGPLVHASVVVKTVSS